MGLCKCPKRKVSTLFCFEHRVNVCEHCLVSDHSQCVVKSYLQWLQDSDYDASCVLCSSPLIEKETIRFLCLHNYHFSCIDEHFSKLSANTAPNGYTCPQCDECIFFSTNVKSPLAEKLKQQYKDFTLAKFSFNINLINLDVSQSTIVNIHDNDEHFKSAQLNNQNETNGLLNLSQSSTTAKNSRLLGNNYQISNGSTSSNVSGYFDREYSNDPLEDKLAKAAKSSMLGRKFNLFMRRFTYNRSRGNLRNIRRMKYYLTLTCIVLALMALFYFLIYTPNSHKTKKFLSARLPSLFDRGDEKFLDPSEEEMLQQAEQAGDDPDYEAGANPFPHAIEQDYLKNPMLYPENNPLIHSRKKYK